MNTKDLMLLSDIVLHKYFTECVFCSECLTCETKENILSSMMELLERSFEDDLSDDLELILGET